MGKIHSTCTSDYTILALVNMSHYSLLKAAYPKWFPDKEQGTQGVLTSFWLQGSTEMFQCPHGAQ